MRFLKKFFKYLFRKYRSLSKKGRRRLIVLLLILLLSGTIFWVWSQFKKPAIGTVTITNQKQAITDSTNYTSYADKYWSLLYPSHYSEQLIKFPAGNYLAYKLYTNDDQSVGSTGQLEIIIKPAPNVKNLSLDSEYAGYSSQEKQYKFSRVFFHSEIVPIATKKSNPSSE